MPQLTVYSSSGDGWVGNKTSNSSPDNSAQWLTRLQASTGTIVNYTNNTAYVGITQNQGNNQLVYRGFWSFDTSSLPDDCIIDSATFSLYGSSNYADTDGKAVALVEGTQASTTQLTTADYSACVRSVSLSDIEIPLHLSNSAYNNWPLNSTGLSKINKTGFTKYATLITPDRYSTHTSGPACGHTVHSSEATGTSNDPKLVIDYTLATTTSTTTSSSTSSTSSSTTHTNTTTTTSTTTTSTSTTTTSTSSTSSSTSSTSSSTSSTSSSTSSTSSSTTMPLAFAIDNV